MPPKYTSFLTNKGQLIPSVDLADLRYAHPFLLVWCERGILVQRSLPLVIGATLESRVCKVAAVTESS